MSGNIPTDGIVQASDNLAQAVAWHLFGECRGYSDGPPMPVNEALAAYRAARSAPEPATKGITHCANCGSDWLDNGINPAWCPYCKQPGEPRVCSYEQVDGSDLHLTGCGHEFYLQAGLELYDFCPHCGAPVETQPETKEARQDCYGAALAPISESDGAIYSAGSRGEKQV